MAWEVEALVDHASGGDGGVLASLTTTIVKEC